MNLLSDKIAVLYGILNNDDFLVNQSVWEVLANRYIKVTNYAYLDDDKKLCININENTIITLNQIVLLDEHTGEDVEVISYREMQEEEFFQLSTVMDLGDCDYSDIKFACKHIDALQVLAEKHYRKIQIKISEYQKGIEASMLREITSEIDKDINTQLTSNSFAKQLLPTPVSNNSIVSIPNLTQTSYKGKP